MSYGVLGRLLHNKTLIRYIVTGVSGVFFELGVIFVAQRVFHASDSLAVSLGFWLGVAFSFLLQKFFAFESREVQPRVLGWQTVSFGVLLLVNYLFTLGVVALLAGVLTVYVARMLALVITTAWNFLVYKHIIFRQSKGNQAKVAPGEK